MFRTRARFKTTKSTKAVLTDHRGTPLETAILNGEVEIRIKQFKRIQLSRTGAQFFGKQNHNIPRCPARERNFRKTGARPFRA